MTLEVILRSIAGKTPISIVVSIVVKPCPSIVSLIHSIAGKTLPPLEINMIQVKLCLF